MDLFLYNRNLRHRSYEALEIHFLQFEYAKDDFFHTLGNCTTRDKKRERCPEME